MGSDMPERIWLHKQSEVVLSRKPESLTSALFESYVRSDIYAGLERQRDELAELLKDTSGALRVNGLGVIAQKVEEALAKAEKDDE
jgi:hypothetical protein